jgi:NAD dependent epimerase/dehydratase family enzyme
MSAPFRYGLGAALGSGKQYMPWIHLDDLVQVIIDSLFGKLPASVYNVVAGDFISNYEFSKQLAKALRKPFYLPAVPAFILKLILGKMSVMILEGSKVSNKKLIAAGFKFKYPFVKEALKAIVSL